MDLEHWLQKKAELARANLEAGYQAAKVEVQNLLETGLKSKSKIDKAFVQLVAENPQLLKEPQIAAILSEMEVEDVFNPPESGTET